MRLFSSTTLLLATSALLAGITAIGCEEDSSNAGTLVTLDGGFDASFDAPSNDAAPSTDDGGPVSDAGADADASDADVSDADADAEPVDAGHASVVLTAPLDGRVGVGTAAKVTVTFSVAMQPSTLTVQATSGACTGSLQLLEGPAFTTCVGGTVTTTDDVTFTFTPAANLGTEVRYKVDVSAAALAADGRTAEPYTMAAGFMTHKFAVDAKVLYMGSSPSANLGGIAGADAICTTKAGRPAGVVAAKAMLTAATRTACSVASCGAGNVQLDWALRPNQHYVRADGAYVFLTDANGIFTAYPAEHDLGTSLNFWDGLNADWTTRAPNCADWTSTTGLGAVGYDVGLNSVWLTGGELACSSGRPFVCAEQ